MMTLIVYIALMLAALLAVYIWVTFRIDRILDARWLDSEE